MSKRNIVDHNDEVRAQLIALGISKEVADRVNAYSVLEADGSGKIFSECLEMGYPVSKNGITRLKLTSISGSFEGGIALVLADQENLSTFLDGGMQGTPASEQLPLPAWVSSNSRIHKQVSLKRECKALVRHTARTLSCFEKEFQR